MFKVSRRLDYGLQLMIALAADSSGHPQPSAQLSQRLQIPLPFLHQIAHTLMQAGLIKASPGPRGGLRINAQPQDISVLKIAETLEGPLMLTPCLDCSDSCVREEDCPSQFMWSELQKTITEYLSNVSLEQLTHQSGHMSLLSLVKKTQPSSTTPVATD